MWWNSNYPFRRSVYITPPVDGAPAGHYVSVAFDASVLATKVREDLEDVEVIYNDTDVLATEIIVEGDLIVVNFPLAADLNAASIDDYYVYYGNIDLLEVPTRPVVTIDYLPMKIDHDGQNVTYTRPGDHWREGRSTTRGARATFVFYGMNIVRLISEVGEDKGILEAQLDEGPWIDVDLFALDTEELAVYEAAVESPGFHELRIRVSGRQNESAISNEVNVRQFQYAKAVLASDGGEEIDDLDWVASVGGAT